MATQETQQLDAIIASRRALLMGGAALGAVALTGVAKAAVPATLGDTDILNFALNLEYLEAQFYTLATEGVYAENAANGPVTGVTANTSATIKLKSASAKATAAGQVIDPVPFASSLIAAYAFETALEERRHVNFLRSALTAAGVTPAPQPVLDLNMSFINLGKALTPSVSGFDPFANDAFFLAGAYIFEDVGVSAYHGGVKPLAVSGKYLLPAAKIHAVEAYHAGLIRSTMSGFDNGYITIPGFTAAMLTAATGYSSLTQLTQAISAVRATLDGTQSGTPDDNGLGLKPVALNTSSATFTSTSILNGDSNYLGRIRTPQQVLNVVYATPGSPTSGGFYPNGLSGTIN